MPNLTNDCMMFQASCWCDRQTRSIYDLTKIKEQKLKKSPAQKLKRNGLAFANALTPVKSGVTIIQIKQD